MAARSRRCLDLVADRKHLLLLNAPSTGGPALRKLPLKARAEAVVHPQNIVPLIHPALSAEGVWVPTETWSGASPPVQVAQFRSDPYYPQMVAGVAWIDTKRTTIALYPGRLEPSVSLPRGIWRSRPHCARGCWPRSTAASS